MSFNEIQVVYEIHCVTLALKDWVYFLTLLVWTTVITWNDADLSIVMQINILYTFLLLNEQMQLSRCKRSLNALQFGM